MLHVVDRSNIHLMGKIIYVHRNTNIKLPETQSIALFDPVIQLYIQTSTFRFSIGSTYSLCYVCVCEVIDQQILDISHQVSYLWNQHVQY